uniref:Vacuolar protein sorting 13 homolog A n=1 Tax=Astyanax mexicanus TaxID=7994 RepID=A0A8B9KUA9_ASTMX
MVFESLVVDVLNRFLGDYVVNLDSSQLNLGIWGGEGADSGQRTAAGSQLDIPFKVRAGHIGRLELKIPWKNLYTQSVEATLDEVYLLIVPTASIKYDAEKEEKQLQEARQRELQRIEETKQKAAQQENPKTEKQDTFVEKLVTQVIKNLQVKISNIHVRYEDDVTNPNCPLSFGVSLQNLSLQLVRLDNLFAYWNVNSELYSNHTPPELRMNPRSDVDFSSPKVDLVVNLPEVAVELSRPQYVSILELLGSVDMMSRNLPYRKYRPCVPVHNNAYNWWRYVISGVLEVNVKPRLHMWSWQHIRRHRQLAKQYKELYKTKITSKKPTEVVLKKLEDTEKTLDIFNITLARQQAEMEVKHRLQTSGFDTLMTPAEKAKLYTAIGYSETAVNPNLPKSVHMKVRFQLVSMSVSIKESREKPEIIKLSVIGLSATLTQRPSAQAIKIIAQLSTFEVTGLPRSNVAPMLLSSRRVVEENKPLLSLMFETNPLDAKADQRLHVESQPLEIIYDATTVNSLSAFFMPPNDLQLDELTNATRMKLEQFRDRTSTGLMYIIETQKVLDLKINLMASYVIVPQMGFYDPSHNLAILDLGHFQVNKANLPQLLAGSSTIEDIMSRAYDSFDVQLSNGDWKKARKERQSALHILEPVDLKVVFSRAMVVTDSRMPKFKMSGELPLLSLRISDDKVRGVLELIDSIPLPESRPPPRAEDLFFDAPSSPIEDLPFFEASPGALERSASVKRRSMVKQDPKKNMTEFLMNFEISKLSIQLLRLSAGQEVPVLHLEIEGLGTELKLRTFDMSSYTFLREICLECSEYQDGDGRKVHLITTLDNTEDDLLTLEYVKADKNAPDFKSAYKNTEQLIKVNFSSLDIHLHTEALLNSMNFLNSLLPPPKKQPPSEQPSPPLEDEGEEDGEEEKKDEHAVVKRSSNVAFTFSTEHFFPITHAQYECEKLKERADCFMEEEHREDAPLTDKNLLSLISLMLYKEVFDFRMVNYVDATEGDAYMDMQIVDTSVTLTVGCIQVIFLNKFVSSVLAFINNFQEAKEALAEVTVQAAEKAATGVLELAEKSTRISLDVDIKAPVVFLPQSSISTNVIVADLGLVTVKNHFEIVPSPSHTKIPPILDVMSVALSDLKMYRWVFALTDYDSYRRCDHDIFGWFVSLVLKMKVNMSDVSNSYIFHPYRTTFKDEKFQTEIQLLKPVNMDLSIKRNLSASWYHSLPDIQINAHLKPMSLILSQEDMIVVLRTLSENLSETSDAVPAPKGSDKAETSSTKESQGSGEFTLGTISTAVHMYSDSSMTASVKLAECLLDDKRKIVKMITSRMMAMRKGAEQNTMVDVNYRQGREGTTLETVVQDLYLCASMEFLLTVADIFMKAMAQGFSSPPKSNKQTSTATKDPAASKMEMNIVVKNPEIVFVADLTRADAPALVMTTQCELLMKSDPNSQQMTAAITDLKVVACPFVHKQQDSNITTVLQPCQVFFTSKQSPTQPQVSPIIINTVITIQSALTPAAETPEELESPVPPDLWERRDWKDLKLWFLEEEGEEDTQSVTPLIPQGESLQLRISSICLTLEAGVGHRTVPMLLAKSSFHGDVKNWSSTSLLMHFLVNLLQVNYYNEIMGVWEPLLEPLEDDTKDGFRPWTLDLKVRSNEVDYIVPDYKTVISITSKDQLNITLTKCGLNMLSNLGTAFAEAAKQTAECFQKDQAPFVVKNRLGLPVSVLYSEVFKPIGVQSKGRTVELQDGESLNMDYTLTTADADQFSAMTSLSSKNYIQPSKTVSVFNCNICFISAPVGHTTASVIPLIKVGRGMYSVMHLDSGVTRFFICQISSNEGSKFVKIRSPFQFINHFSVPFRVFEGSTCLGVSLPNEEFCVPLGSYKAQLSLQPAAEGDEQYECSESFSYDEVSQKPDECVEKTCRHHSSDAHVFKVNMVAVRDTVTSLSAQEEFDKPYVLHLWPTVLLRNLLPYPITYSLLLHTAVMDHSSLELKLLGYLQQDWVAHYHLRNDHDEINFITFRSALQDDDVDGESSRAELDIAVHVKKEAGQAVVAVHSPYWMVNKTGRLLQYKADDIHRKHPKDYDMPLLFSFKPRNFLQNNKVRLMISDSELSDDFSIDTVGSYGDVKCKGRAKDYLVGVKIDASSFSLTRLVTVLPFYMLVNRTKHVIRVCEEGQDEWTEAAVPFWPERESKKMKVKVDGCQTAAHTINFHQPENCLLLHLDNTLGGIIVDVNLTEHSAVIRFSDYHDGAAPFLLINHTKDKTLEFYQSSHQQEKEELAPGRAVYYTWAEPTGSRVLRWSWGPYSGELKNEEGKLFVISFYEGLQRVALFTTERRIYKLLCESERVELAEQEISLALQDMGISLVNNSTSQEIAYIGITSSDVVWEIKPKKKSRWKVLNGKDAEILEQHYKSYLESSPVDHSLLDLENGYQVCLTPNGVDMRMLQPYDAPLRRNFLPALKVEYSFTKQLLLFCPQIQNQLPGAIFPFVFYPIKPPKSVRMDSGFEFGKISYFFQSCICDVMAVTYLLLKRISLKLCKIRAVLLNGVVDEVVFLIVQLHLSFSLSSGGEDGNKTKRETEMIPVQSLNLLLKSIGATLTDVQDVVFKLAFFELTFQFRTTQQLQWEVIRHYSKQAIKQMYVLVLGLDVLGNPFGLIRGLSEGVEAFFYEPYQGAIQGPEEFVEGMALGVKALVGGAVGGLAGAASRITGAMAKGVAAMTMDEEYQQKRREAMNKQPSGLKEGLTRGGKGLVSGFVSGITGIVTKPIKGAQKEGAAGFFKGVGKGLVGAVTRPTGGIIDMASSTFQGIKRAAETSQDVESLRPPRFIHEDGVIRPYKEREGFGSQMLQVTCSLLTCRLPSFPYSQIYYIKKSLGCAGEGFVHSGQTLPSSMLLQKIRKQVKVKN